MFEQLKTDNVYKYYPLNNGQIDSFFSNFKIIQLKRETQRLLEELIFVNIIDEKDNLNSTELNNLEKLINSGLEENLVLANQIILEKL